jgi:hypothetical protein
MPKTKMQTYTFEQFNAEFGDDETCLEWLKNYLYPNGIHCVKCGKVTAHYRIASRPSYSCQFCGNHVHPTAETIFHKSSTSLRTWFYAVYLMSSTRCGISAKQIQRETGVTYKTAWRMFKQIRSMLNEDVKLRGSIEMDETFFGGVRKYEARRNAYVYYVFGSDREGAIRRETCFRERRKSARVNGFSLVPSAAFFFGLVRFLVAIHAHSTPVARLTNVSTVYDGSWGQPKGDSQCPNRHSVKE